MRQLNKCLQCGKEFNSFPSAHRKYCSLKCHYVHSTTRVKKTCKYCGREFEITLLKSKKGEGKYCSPQCCGKDPVHREKIGRAHKGKILSEETNIIRFYL